MVHKYTKIPKMNLDILDSLSKIFNWEIVEKKKEYRLFRRGNLELKYTTVLPYGYKIIRMRDGKPITTDSTPHKETSLTLLGESLAFERW